YGRWIFNRYLAERHSPALIRDIWARLGTMAFPSDGSDIPMLPVIDAVIQQNGGTLAGDFAGFAKKMYLRDWGPAHAADIALIPTLPPKASYSVYPLDLSAVNGTIQNMPGYTFAYFRIVPAATAPTDLTLALPNVPAAVTVVALKKGSDGSVQEFPLDRGTG